jgi:GTP-binding protein EngB required for normal cell division
MANHRLSKENILPITQRFMALAANLKEEQSVERIKPVLEQYRLGLFRLVVVGEIKKGKSSFINALLGEPDLLPTMSDVATSTVYKILYGKEKKYKVFFLPQDIEHPETSTPPPLEITPEQVAEYGTENGNPGNKKNVDFIGVQLPHPLLKAGVVIIDTPGLGGVFREHQYITWRYIPNADAIFFVMDSVEAVASRAEMEYLRKLRTMTPLLFFVQTKIDLVETERWQQWRDRNLDIIANTLQVPKEKLIYFPVSAQLKRYADEDKSPSDLNESGYMPLLHFFHNKLLRAKEQKLAEGLMQSIAAETVLIRRRMGEQLQILNTSTKEELATLEREFMETKTQFEHWRMTEYQRALNEFQTAANDLKRETLEVLQNQLDPSPHGPIIDPMISELRQGNISAKQLNQEVKAIRSSCVDQCTQHIFNIQRHYEQAMTQLISATSEKLGQSYTVNVSTSTKDTSLPSVESLNMHFSNFERARNVFYGGMAGSMIGSTAVGLLSGLAIGLLFPPAAAAAFIAQFAGTIVGIGGGLGFLGGGWSAKHTLDVKLKEEALTKLQSILMDAVRLAQKQAIQQFQNVARGYERAASSAFEGAAARISQELQDKLKSIAEARKRAREENQEKASELQAPLKQVDQLLRDIGQLAGTNVQTAAA